MFTANRRCEQCSKPLLLHDWRGLYDPRYWSFWPSILESPSTNQYHGREHCSYVHKLTQECMCTMGRTARSSRCLNDEWLHSSFKRVLPIYQRLRCWAVTESILEILKLNEVSTIPQPHSASKLALVNIQICDPSCHSMPFPIQYHCHWSPWLVRWNPWLESALRVGWCSFSSRRSGDWHFYGQRLSILSASQDSIHRFLGFPLRPSKSSNADLGVSQLSVFWWQSWVQILCWQIFLILFVSFCLSNPPVSLSISLSACVGWDINISCRELWKKNYSITIYYYLKLHQIRILHKHLQFGGMA